MNTALSAWRSRGPSDADERFLRRLRFAKIDFDLDTLVMEAARGQRSVTDVRLDRTLRPDVSRVLERDAPEALQLPSGRSTRLDYNEDGSVGASAKLQELFGLGETPRVGPRREPVVFSLLAPNGRPVQVTRDLAGFWRTTYFEVRRDLKGRYPRHYWPDDPLEAAPTRRVKPRN